MNVIGVSAGNGVMLFPFREYVRANIELRSDYTIRKDPAQFRLNFPDALWETRLVDLPFQVDVLLGHPKCGNSSTLALSRGKKLKTHVGEPSLELFLSAIDKYQPNFILLENLPGLLDSVSIEDFQVRFPEYFFEAWVGSMAVLGNGQHTRNRLIITGVKSTVKHALAMIRDLQHKFQVHPVQITAGLLLDLPRNGNFRPSLDESIALYGGTQKTYQEIQDMWLSNPDATRVKTPDENFSSAPGVYRDLPYRYPATIRKSNRCFNPQGLTYSPRERARIQGIPDEFKILDSGYDQRTLFNKGCVTTGSSPCYEVAYWFKEVLIPWVRYSE